MFDILSDKLNGVFQKFGRKTQLTEANIQEGLREVRIALLEADVNIKVVKEFIDKISESCLGERVIKDLNPGQQVIKIVHEELIELLGGDDTSLKLDGKKPSVVMMVGLQGSGKTTSTGKIANFLKESGRKPYLVPADVYRPAAIEQLSTIAKQLEVPCYPSTTLMPPVEIAKAALAEASLAGCDVVLIDTAGRLHIDEPLMQELKSIKSSIVPSEILFVADAMTGQDAVTVAKSFDDDLGISGIVLTKMDGDARGGAALSIKAVTGKSVKFVGIGEKISELEPFYPDRIAGRILGMGDMLTLIEKAQANFDEQEAEILAKKMQKAEFDFNDFHTQLKRMKSMGSLSSIMKMIPGLSSIQKKLGDMSLPEKELAKTEAIINSMTKQEKLKPSIINASRKLRIAKGCGLAVSDVNKLLKQFDNMRSMMQKMASGKAPKLPGGGNLGNMLGGSSPFAGIPGMPQDFGDVGGRSEEEQKKLRAKRKAERQRKKKKR